MRIFLKRFTFDAIAMAPGVAVKTDSRPPDELKHPLIFQPTASTAAVAEFSMIKAWKRSKSSINLGSGMLGMAS